MTSLSPHEWFKSSYSGGSGTECVECMRGEGGALVRDSKQESGPLITVQRQAWDFFLSALQRGDWA
ncbi:DUF397 domain-containing protein [Streptomyces sp. NPDC020597]|uniref:DUF397 domain-containing protein n=1 Tax=unclassified Streptomyces TaxID=2593676 RepID=UPI0037B28EB2